MLPSMDTIESARGGDAESVSRTIAPGSGCAGAIVRRGACAPSELEKKAKIANVVVLIFTSYPCIDSV